MIYSNSQSIDASGPVLRPRLQAPDPLRRRRLEAQFESDGTQPWPPKKRSIYQLKKTAREEKAAMRAADAVDIEMEDAEDAMELETWSHYGPETVDPSDAMEVESKAVSSTQKQTTAVDFRVLFPIPIPPPPTVFQTPPSTLASANLVKTVPIAFTTPSRSSLQDGPKSGGLPSPYGKLKTIGDGNLDHPTSFTPAMKSRNGKVEDDQSDSGSEDDDDASSLVSEDDGMGASSSSEEDDDDEQPAPKKVNQGPSSSLLTFTPYICAPRKVWVD